jgi:menaquinone-specific isochorismate synthase
MESLRDESGGSADPSFVESRSREVADVSYRAFFESFDGPRIYWTTPEGLEIAGVGAAATLTGVGPGRFDQLRAAADHVFGALDHDGPSTTRPRAFGGLSFHDQHVPDPPWGGFPAAQFVVPRVQLVRSNGSTHVTVTNAGEKPPATLENDLDGVEERVTDLPAMRPTGGSPGVATRRQRTPRAEWMAGVERVVDRIEEGELRKVVLATALDVDLAGAVSVPNLMERLRRTYPDCFRFLIQPNGAGFFGAPPERLVRLDGRSIRTEALAGSVARGDTPEEDDRLAASLLESDKLQHEQRLVVDAICDQLEPLADVTERQQGVRKLATIQHLETPIEGRLDTDEHVLSIVEALHPTPAVGGLPPGSALQTIRETETFDRGWYASPIGWFDADGDGEFAVAIRSAVANDDRVTLFAGNGIVADSDPAEEWEEVQLKFRPILDELETPR